MISDGMMYHINKKLPLTENVFRVYSDAFFNLLNEARELYEMGIIDVDGSDLELLKSDVGRTGIYEGEEVYLDIPFEENLEEHLVEAKHRGRNVKLNHPLG